MGNNKEFPDTVYQQLILCHQSIDMIFRTHLSIIYFSLLIGLLPLSLHVSENYAI